MTSFSCHSQGSCGRHWDDLCQHNNNSSACAKEAEMGKAVPFMKGPGSFQWLVREARLTQKCLLPAKGAVVEAGLGSTRCICPGLLLS